MKKFKRFLALFSSLAILASASMMASLAPASAEEEMNAGMGLILDGDMEEGAWVENDYASTETRAEYVHSGLKSMKLNVDAANANGSLSYDAVKSADEGKFRALDFENKTYAFTMWVKAESFTGTLWVEATLFQEPNYAPGGNLYDPRINNPGISGIQIIGGNVRPDNGYVDPVTVTEAGWVQYTTVVATANPDPIAMHVRIRANGTGTLWVDDVDMVEIAPAEELSGVLPEGGMENGAWVENGYASTETRLDYVHSGLKSMKLNVDAASANGSLSYDAVKSADEGKFRALDFENKTYAFTMWVKAENFTGTLWVEATLFQEPNYAPGGNLYDPRINNPGISGIQIIGGNVRPDNGYVDPVTVTEDGWVKYTTVVATANPDPIAMHVRIRANGTGTLWVDDVDMVEYAYLPAEELSGILPEGDMEEGAWVENDYASTETRAEYVHSGLKSMKLNVDAANANGSLSYDAVKSADEGKFQALDFENKTYAFTMWVKAENFTGTLWVEATLFQEPNYAPGGNLYDPRINNPGISGIQIIGGNVRPDNGYVDPVTVTEDGWIKYTTVVATANPDPIAMHVRIRANGTGTLWVDDVDLVEYAVEKPPVGDPGDTVITNGNMESGAWVENAFASTETNPEYVHGGDKSMKFNVDAANADGNLSFANLTGVNEEKFQALDFKTKKYAFTMWVKAENFTGTLWAEANLYDTPSSVKGKLYDPRIMPSIDGVDDEGIIGGIQIIGGNVRSVAPYVDAVRVTKEGWIQYTTMVETSNPDAISMDMRLRANGTGILWVDDVDLVEYIDSGEEPVDDGNLVINGNFEAGGVEHDIQVRFDTTAEFDTEVKYEGDTSLHLSGTQVSGYGYVGSILKPGSFDPTARYRISLWMKTSNLEGKAYLKMLQGNDKDEPVGWVVRYGRENHFEITGDTEWTKYEMDLFGFRDGAIQVHIYQYLEGKGDLWIDDIRFEKIEFDPNVPAGTVVATEESGELEPMTQISLIAGSENGDIYYTVDGSDPKSSAAKILFDSRYPIVVTEDMVLKAYVAADGASDGEVVTYNYTCAGLVDNGGFEEGLWESNSVYNNFEIDTDVVKEGDQSLRVDAGVTEQTMETGWIGLEPMYDYRLAFWLKTENMSADTVVASMRLQSSEGEIYFTEQPHFLVTGGTQDWTEYTVNLDRLQGSTFSALNLQIGVQADSGTVWVDGVKLVALQKENHPITVLPDSAAFGNLFYESIYDPYFSPEVGVTLKNSAKCEQRLTVVYTITNDKNGRVYPGEELTTEVPPNGETRIDRLDLTMVSEYGTYTVNFEITDQYGVTYQTDSMQIARMYAEQEPDENDDFIGVCADMLTANDPLWKERLDQMASAGITWVRTDLRWETIEREKGVYTWPSYLDERLAYAKEIGINVLFIIGTNNCPFYDDGRFPTSKEALEGYANYCTAVANRFLGVVDHYEIGNEFNLTNPDSPVSMYVDVVKVAYTALKAVDPGIQVVSGVTSSLDMLFLREMFVNGVYDYTDIISIHPYAEANARPEDVKIVERIQELHEMIASYGNGVSKPIWATELGWTTPHQLYYSITDEEHAAYTARMLALKDSAVLDKIFYYMDRDAGGSDYNWQHNQGLTRQLEAAVPGEPKPALLAMGAKTTLTFGTEFVGMQSLTGNVNVFRYKKADGSILLVLYAVDDRTKSVTLKLTGEDALLYDMYGNPSTLDFEAANTAELQITGSLYYVLLGEGAQVEDILVEDVASPEDPTNSTAPTNPGKPGENSPTTGYDRTVGLLTSVVVGAIGVLGTAWSLRKGRKRKSGNER